MTDLITPELLADAPELATLAVLEKLLLVATQALIAEHSTLRQAPWPLELQEEPATLREARRVLQRISRLQSALPRYQRAVLDAVAPRGDDKTTDLPF